MKIIAFTGMPFTGKSEAVRIAEESGIPVVRMGDAVWAEVKQRGLALNDHHVGVIADQMRKTQGKDIWARRTVERIHSLKGTDRVVIDGIRNREEVEFFKRVLGNDFVIIAVDAPTEIRRHRALSRKRIDDGVTLKSFEERDKRELRWGLGEVIASADTVIVNDQTLPVFRERVKQLLQSLR